MPRFLYFIPGATAANASALSAHGLIDRFSAAGGNLIEHVANFCDAGPGGNSGILIAAGPNPPAYQPQTQRWTEGLRFWAGLEDASLPPRPQDLAREVGIAGYELVMTDGSTWRAPLIRRWDEGRCQHVPNVPTYFAPIVERGKRRYVRAVDPKYQAVDALAEATFDRLCAQTVISIEQLYEDATTMLAVNYRIGVEEAGLLGILDEVSALNVLKLSVDEPVFARIAVEMKLTGLQPAEPIVSD